MNNQQNSWFTAKNMALVGVLTALVFAANWISIPIPTPLGSTRFHLGNVMCLLSGFLLGPVAGGFAAGLGSMFFDFTYPEYVSEAWITFLMKFAMACLCGLIARRGGARLSTAGKWRRNTVAAVSGALLYVILYVSKNFVYSYFFLRMELTPVLLTVAQKGAVSLVNGIIAVAAVLPLNTALRAALSRAKLVGGSPDPEDPAKSQLG